MTFAEIAAAAERLPVAERLHLLERLARSLRRDLPGRRPAPPDPETPRAGLQPDTTSLDDDEVEELIAEALFEDLG